MKLGVEEREAIARAVTEAERRTDAEILVIAAEQSDSYHDVALQWSLLAALLVLALLASFPDAVTGAFDGITGNWQHVWTASELLTMALVGAVAAFLVAWFVLRSRALRIKLTPRATQARRVRRRAIDLFRAGVEQRTATHSGALLYLSLSEHRAEIVADAAVHQHVPAEKWGDAMVDLIQEMRAGRTAQGIIVAVRDLGEILAAVLPHSGSDPDELPNRLIEL